VGIVGQGRQRAVVVGDEDQTRLEENLEAVTDAKDQLVPGPKPVQGVTEKVLQLNGEDLAGRHVVAVGKSAWNHENLKVVQQLGRFAQSMDVHALRDGAGKFEGEVRLDVTVCPRGTQDQHARLGHALILWMRPACNR